MFTVTRRYYETDEISDLGSYESEEDALDGLVRAIVLAYERGHGLSEEDIFRQLARARREKRFEYYDAAGSFDSLFEIT